VLLFRYKRVAIYVVWSMYTNVCLELCDLEASHPDRACEVYHNGQCGVLHVAGQKTHMIVCGLLFLFRNLSACGSYEICNLLVEQDVMTPLAALLQEVWNMLLNPLLVVFVHPKHGVEFLLEVHVLGKS
jgi:hypothetical protein